MSKPLVSIYIPAIRIHWWMRVYESLLSNKNVDFELIFVGHIKPDYPLPSNMIHIFTPVKPAQCAEIGFRACKGEFNMTVADDYVFSDRCLDLLYDKFMEIGEDLLVVSCIHHAGGQPIPKEKMVFSPLDPKGPVHPMGGLYKTEVHKSLGPRDRNFVCTYSDLDMAMRLYTSGGRAVFCDEAHVHEINPPGTKHDSGLNWDGSKIDFPFVTKLWIPPEYTIWYPKGVYLKTRSQPVEPFVEEGLLTESQGPKGRWV